LATDAQQEAEKLKTELGQKKAKLEEGEKQKAKVQTQAEEKEGSLRKSIETLLGDVYTRFYSYRQCWASKCRGL
jgi:hypothetical protein